MRTFLMTVFWVTNIGAVIQFLVIGASIWIISIGDYSFSGLTGEVFITQYVPWLLWIKTLVLALFGSLGYWILSIPVLVIACIKFVGGLLIGVWAYITAQNIPVKPAYTG